MDENTLLIEALKNFKLEVDEETAIEFQIARLRERQSELQMKRCKCVIGGTQIERCPVHPYLFSG